MSFNSYFEKQAKVMELIVAAFEAEGIDTLSERIRILRFILNSLEKAKARK